MVLEFEDSAGIPNFIINTSSKVEVSRYRTNNGLNPRFCRRGTVMPPPKP